MESRKRPLRIVIVCTGAGGHLIAGLAIAQALINKLTTVHICFLGSWDSRAERIITAAGFSYYRLPARGWLPGMPAKVFFIFSQLITLVQSLILLLFARGDLVVATGGFASAGVIIGSYLLNIPVVIQEQNLYPGKANLFCARFAKKIFVSFAETKDYFRRYPCVLTGMPRRRMQHSSRPEARARLNLFLDKFTILVTGGSSGSRQINQLFLAALEKLSFWRDRIQVIHLTGNLDYNLVAGSYRSRGIPGLVQSYSFAMADNYSAADLVVSRAGSSAISEIVFFGLPAVLIPYPYSRDRHQLANAELLQRKGAAVVLTGEGVTSFSLAGEIEEFIKNPQRGKGMAARTVALAEIDAAEKIAGEIIATI